MKKIVILGSTGSIGENTLRVVEALAGRFRVVGLAANRNAGRVLAQARRFGVRHIALADEGAADRCAAASRGVRIHRGPAGVEEVAALEGADVVVCAVVGMSGLKPVLAALRRGIDVALATKEVLVAAGHMVSEACRKHGARILPIDSEQSAIFQCLAGEGGAVGNGRCAKSKGPAGIRRLILTASGGPFAFRKRVNFDRVTTGEALAHPNWDMGRKVTVDSATLMNKGLEMIEARWLFHVPMARIDVLVHPESIVHSMVEFTDGNVLAQLSVPDMRFAIQYALTYPERVDGSLPALDLAKVGTLRFLHPDEKRFPCLRLAREAAEVGGTMPAVMNGANEVAVETFLRGKMSFSGIWRVVEKVMERHQSVKRADLAAVLEADGWARERARGFCRGSGGWRRG